LTLLILLMRSQAVTLLATGLPIPNSLMTAKKVPYGIAIGAAGLITYAEAPIVKAAIASLS
jgi:prepilin peptidase CpaA